WSAWAVCRRPPRPRAPNTYSLREVPHIPTRSRSSPVRYRGTDRFDAPETPTGQDKTGLQPQAVVRQGKAWMHPIPRIRWMSRELLEGEVEGCHLGCDHVRNAVIPAKAGVHPAGSSFPKVC